MGGKIHAFLLNAAQLRQREYLESAAVGEGGTRPAAEFLQTAQLMDQSVAGTEVEVVAIGQHNLAVHVPQILGGDTALDGSTSGHVHENGGLDLAVGRDQTAAAGFSVFFLKNKHIRPRFRHNWRDNCLSMEFFLISNATGRPWGQVLMAEDPSFGTQRIRSQIHLMLSPV